MIIGKNADIVSSEITPESIYLQRREFIRSCSTVLAGIGTSYIGKANAVQKSLAYKKASSESQSGFYTNEKQTSYEDATRFNNFYEFGSDKKSPSRYAYKMKVDPWSIKISGEVDNPGTYQFGDFISGHSLQERIYRMRCVEAWSMVVPWVGIPLKDLLAPYGITSKARYVEFTTLYDPENMRGQRSYTSAIKWPYKEGLRIDEAMHPLTILATGMYGRELPKQNGAPLRLVVPWKYGFKSIKSIVQIRLLKNQPRTSWQSIAPREYGFFANVNPLVDHPRWTQKTERRLPSTIFSPNRIDTRLFNGYGDQVASLYTGMDLSRHY
tara:strand:+ start:97 stop:1071 length:975 start_codon:yes stop_codon:yes gene_type:complete